MIKDIILPHLFTKNRFYNSHHYYEHSMESDASSMAAEYIDSVGFWLSFTLIVGVSAVEALASIVWTRIRLSAIGVEHSELSARACGRVINSRIIDNETARQITDAIAERGPGGCAVYTSVNTCNINAVIDLYGSISMVTTIAIRRFNPSMSLEGARGLVNNFIELLGGAGDIHHYENIVHIFVTLVDISLGISGLVLIPASPQNLWDTLQDVSAPMTLDNYLTLFLLWWILGVLLLVAMLPLRSQERGIQLLGCLGLVVYVIATMASLVLFGLGCWKIDFARRNGLDWTPMLSYWIGGASSISFPFCGIEIFHTFGFVGLVFMLLDTF